MDAPVNQSSASLESGCLYDFPKYYDLVYGSDWKAEFDFLEDVFQVHGVGEIRSLFEPACGTGRLLYRFAKAGYDVAGIDLNAKAVNYCNDRLRRYGFSPTAHVANMVDYRHHSPADAAFNMINSFRHLGSESEARGHLESVAQSLTRGGLYILGLHLTPTTGSPLDNESWAARRGNLSVISRLETEERDLENRVERVRMHFDVYTPTRSFRLTDLIEFRTYLAAQLDELLQMVPTFQLVGTYDFAYSIDHPIQITPATEDLVLVLQRV